MSPVERLQAAIDKLDALKADSTPGPWQHWPEAGDIEVYSDWRDPDARPSSEVVILPRVRPRGGWGRDVEIYADNYEPNAELIVTLHRTIDAQLAILRGALESVPAMTGVGIDPEIGLRGTLALADAILGDQS